MTTISIDAHGLRRAIRDAAKYALRKSLIDGFKQVHIVCTSQMENTNTGKVSALEIKVMAGSRQAYFTRYVYGRCTEKLEKLPAWSVSGPELLAVLRYETGTLRINATAEQLVITGEKVSAVFESQYEDLGYKMPDEDRATIETDWEKMRTLARFCSTDEYRRVLQCVMVWPNGEMAATDANVAGYYLPIGTPSHDYSVLLPADMIKRSNWITGDVAPCLIEVAPDGIVFGDGLDSAVVLTEKISGGPDILKVLRDAMAGYFRYRTDRKSLLQICNVLSAVAEGHSKQGVMQLNFGGNNSFYVATDARTVSLGWESDVEIIGFESEPPSKIGVNVLQLKKILSAMACEQVEITVTNENRALYIRAAGEDYANDLQFIIMPVMISENS